MKNHSFTEGLVVVQLANKSYNVLFESADLLNMTIKLKKLHASSTRVVDSQTLRYFIKRNFSEDTSKMFSVLHYTLGLQKQLEINHTIGRNQYQSFTTQHYWIQYQAAHPELRSYTTCKLACFTL